MIALRSIIRWSKISYLQRFLKKLIKSAYFLSMLFFSEFLLDKGKKNILMGEYIKLSKDFLTNDEVKYFNFLLDDIAQKAPWKKN